MSAVCGPCLCKLWRFTWTLPQGLSHGLWPNEGAAVVFDPHGVISQRSLGKDGVLRDGALHALARRPAWEIWQNLRLWFAYVQHLEIGACSRNAHLGRSRALVRDLNRALEGLMTRFKKALENGLRWLLFAPQRGKFWGHACVARMLAYDGVFRTPLAGAGRAREDIQVVALHNCQTLHQSVMELDCSTEQGILQLIPDFQLFKNVEDALLHNVLDGPRGGDGCATAYLTFLVDCVARFTAVWIHAPAAAGTRPKECRPGTCKTLLVTMQPGQELEHLKFFATMGRSSRI